MKMFPPLLKPARLALVAVLAAAPGIARSQALDEVDQSNWSVRVGAVARFNVKSTLSAIPKSAGPGVYDDGYVLPDIGGASSGVTWNWGYQSDNQITGNNLQLNRLDGVPTIGSQDVSGDGPNLGGEIIVAYRIASFKIAKRPAMVSLELGYGYSAFSKGLSFGSTGVATRTSDTYSLGGISPPPAPYGGTEEGPGPLIDLAYANRAMVSSAASTSLQGDLDVAFHDFRFGPALAMQFGKRVDVAVGIGYSSVYPDVKLRYVETTTFSNPAIPPMSPSNVNVNQGQWCPGFYAEMRLNCRLTDHWGVFVGGGYQYNTSYSFNTAGQTLKIDMGSTYTAKAGVNFQF